jgi:hypothetical protein
MDWIEKGKKNGNQPLTLDAGQTGDDALLRLLEAGPVQDDHLAVGLEQVAGATDVDGSLLKQKKLRNG